ncbi:MAG: hypothetical protein GXX96_06120 [Planctomycetaceae bacterium]|nr:hypothetical protein [Planctomycetaceae bacterium]
MNAPPELPIRNHDDRARSRRLILDASVGGALVLALLIVLVIDALSGQEAARQPVIQEVVGETKPAELVATRLRLAVTPPEYDDMGSLLDTLGQGYQYETIQLDDLLAADRLKCHDVVFLTCGGVPTSWLSQRLRDSERGSAGVYRAKPETVRALYDSLRDFVRDGGTLYVSDFHFDVLVIAFPEYVDEQAVGRGAVQTIEATVVDEGLKGQLGEKISLRFDKRDWRPAAFRTTKVTTYLEGEFELLDGTRREGALLVSFPYGKGTVVFTSFHNEAQNSDIEKLLLRYLVFATVTAREQEDVRQVLVKGGFSPRQRNLLALTTEEQPITDSYQHEEVGPLQFVLGFANRGARLRLTVTSPGGERLEKSGQETFSIRIEQAKVGKWQYTIAPEQVPYRNFPFTLTVAEKADQ